MVASTESAWRRSGWDGVNSARRLQAAARSKGMAFPVIDGRHDPRTPRHRRPVRRGHLGRTRGRAPPRPHLLHRRPRPGHRGDRRGRPVPLVLRGNHRHLGRGGSGRRRHPVLRRPELRPARARDDARREERAGCAGRPARRRRGARGPAGGHGRRPGARRRPHREEGHPGRRPAGRQGLLGPGEPHGERPGLAGHGEGLRGREGRPGRAHDGRARGRAGGRWRHPRPAVGGHHRRPRDLRAAAPGPTGSSTFASRITRGRSRSCAACCTSPGPTAT